LELRESSLEYDTAANPIRGESFEARSFHHVASRDSVPRTISTQMNKPQNKDKAAKAKSTLSKQSTERDPSKDKPTLVRASNKINNNNNNICDNNNNNNNNNNNKNTEVGTRKRSLSVATAASEV
jgi:hypothetical protein